MDDKLPDTHIVTENENPMRRGIRAMLGRIGDGRYGTNHRGLAVRQQRF
jgi:hypothetical protein